MSAAATLAPAAPPSAQDPIRVMIVDDAVVVRGLVSRWVDEAPDLKTVASLRTGRDAVEQVSRINPDVVVLDIEMPDMDGLTALPLLLGKKRDLIIIMASTLTRRNAEVSLKALSLGAAAGAGGADGTLNGTRARASAGARLRRAPRWRIFSIRSCRKVVEVVTSRLLAGFGM